MDPFVPYLPRDELNATVMELRRRMQKSTSTFSGQMYSSINITATSLAVAQDIAKDRK